MSIRSILLNCILTAVFTMSAVGGTLAGEQPGSAVDAKSEPASTLLRVPTPSPWQFEVQMWPWLPEIVGQTTVRGQTAPLNYDEGQNLRALRAAVFGEVAVRYKRFSFTVEGFYLKVGYHINTDTDLIQRIGISVGTTNVDWSFAYRPLESRLGYLDVVAGARYLRLNVDLNLRPGPLGKTLLTERSPSGTEDAIDPYVGLRGRINFSRRYYGTFRGQYASFGVGTRVDYLVSGDLGVQLTPRVTMEAGYRYVKIDYRNADFRYDVRIDGPEVRLGYAF